MDTATCPHCKQTINSQAVTCPFCRTELKAFGHPGIPVYRAAEDEFLCSTCTYHADDTCNYPKRPHAKECTLYQNEEERKLELQQQNQKPTANISISSWIRRNQSLLLILGLLLICFLLVLSSS